MSRLPKRRIMTFLALIASIWTIFAAVYLNVNEFKTRFKPKNEELIDFRVIVLTFNRPISLLKVLRSLDTMELDGDKAVLEIWVDRSKSGRVDAKTVKVAQSFNWTRGPTRVHIQENHAGICGQWIDSWRPTNSKELSLIIEDDLSISKYAYRWIKAVHGFYDKREEFAGASLVSDQLSSLHASTPMIQVKAPKNETVFMYICFGPWGFSPKQAVWKRFQTWYHTHVNDTRFHPYVNGIRPTQWFKAMEKKGTSDSVWTQWFIYFSNIDKLYTVYNNLPTYVGDGKSCLSINRREVGLHNSRKGREDLCKLLNRWDEMFFRFPENITKFGWSGRKVVETGANERLTFQATKLTSMQTAKFNGAGKIGLAVETSANDKSTSQPIRLSSMQTVTLDGAEKKMSEQVSMND